MDVGKQRGVARNKFENFREHSPWSMVAYQHQLKEQNAMNMNRKLLHIIAERDAAIEERNQALLEKNRALEAREKAMLQRNLAIKERNDAINERDNALNALQDSMRQPVSSENRHRTDRLANLTHATHEMEILNAFCRTAVEFECNMSPQPKKKKEDSQDSKGCASKPRKCRQTNSQIMGLNRVDYDSSIVPTPGCSCTGVFRQCYKWGYGGWQSSCCTTTISAFPLPPVPNKKYARMGGRKMTGSAFSKLLSRLALQGFDLSIPVDMKGHWSKHGTNRYITIK